MAETEATAWVQQGTELMREAGRAEQAREAEVEAARGSTTASVPEPANDNAPTPEAAPREASTNARLTAETAQRHAAREAARRDAETHRQRAAQIEAYAREHLVPSAQRFQELKRAEESGDLDGMARALGHADWAAFQEDKIQRLTNPSHAKTLELERRLAEREAREQRAEQERAAQLQAQQQQAARQAYAARMAEEAKASSNPVLREFAGTPAFIAELFAVRSAHYQETGAELPLDQCLEVKRPSGLSILDELEGYSRTADRYRTARKGAAAAKPAGEVKPKATEKRSTVRSELRPWERNRRAEDAAWDAAASRELGRAFAEERKSEEQRRR